MSINRSSKQKELAKEFIDCLFSDKMQQKMLNNGFPISEAALKEWLEYENEGIF